MAQNGKGFHQRILLIYDFFEQFDKEERLINKYKLREEIIFQSQEII